MFKNLIKKIFLVFLFMSWQYFALAQACDYLPQQTDTKAVDVDLWINHVKSKIHKETLDNGLTILFYHKEHTPEVMLQIVYDVGSRDEESQEYGFAHLIEHMIFKGTEKLSEKDIDEIATKFGAISNAYTSYDKTAYWFYTDNKNWKVFLDILADCMGNVRFDEDQLSSEIKAVYEEIKTRDEDGSGNLFTELFPSNHPYHHPVLGYKENILNVDVQDVKVFYKKYYKPSRATIFVVGDLDKDDVVSEVKSKFGEISFSEEDRCCKENSRFKYLKKDFSQKDIVVYKPIQQTVAHCLWSTSNLQDAQGCACSTVLNGYLSDKIRDKLFYDQKGLVLGTGVSNVIFLDAGVFVVSFAPQKNTGFLNKKSEIQIIETCKKLIIEEINKVISEGIPQDELTRIKRSIKVASLESFEDCLNISDILTDSYLINKNEYEFFDHLEIIESIKNEQVKDFAYQYLRPNLMNTLSEKPLEGKEKDNWLKLQEKVDEYDSSLLALKIRATNLGDALFAKTLKPELLDFSFEQPDCEFDLSNGLRVVVKQRKDVPFIFVSYGLKKRDILQRYFEEGKKGAVPSLSMLLLLEGSNGYSKQDHEQFFDSLGVRYGMGGFGGWFSCLSSDFVVVADRCVHILTKPTYPKKVFKKIIYNMLQQLEEKRELARYVANYNLLKHLYQDDFLSCPSIDEEIKVVASCKKRDLTNFHRNYVVPQNMVLVVVGDFDKDLLKEQLENSFGQWNSAKSTTNKVCDLSVDFPTVENPEPKEKNVYLPKERVLLCGGRITVTKKENDFLKLCLLGEYLYEKLRDVREEHGLFYGCNAGVLTGASWEERGYAKVTVEISLENVDVVTSLIKGFLRDIAENGIPQKDFDAARNSFINRRAKSDVTNNRLADSYFYIKEQELDWNYYDERFEKLFSVLREDVNEVAKKYLNPDSWSFVTVGRVDGKDEKEIA